MKPDNFRYEGCHEGQLLFIRRGSGFAYGKGDVPGTEAKNSNLCPQIYVSSFVK